MSKKYLIFFFEFAKTTHPPIWAMSANIPFYFFVLTPYEEICDLQTSSFQTEDLPIPPPIELSMLQQLEYKNRPRPTESMLRESLRLSPTEPRARKKRIEGRMNDKLFK